MDQQQRWFLFPWFEEHGLHHVHPDDLETLRQLAPYGKVFQDMGSEKEFRRLGYGNVTVRVTKDLLQEISVSPRQIYSIGEEVELVGKREVCRIAEIYWHHEKGAPFYFLMINGKNKSKRYWHEDIRLYSGM